MSFGRDWPSEINTNTRKHYQWPMVYFYIFLCIHISSLLFLPYDNISIYFQAVHLIQLFFLCTLIMHNSADCIYTSVITWHRRQSEYSVSFQKQTLNIRAMHTNNTREIVSFFFNYTALIIEVLLCAMVPPTLRDQSLQPKVA